MNRSSPSSEILSPAIYCKILSSNRLRKLLLPDGIPTSPYEILDYQAMLTLHDKRGVRATFERKQKIRFLQNGVSGILDHAWGDGIVLTYYDNEAGSLEDWFKDEGRRHLVIGLKRPMGRGETLEFGVTRTSMVEFTKDKEWLETVIDHPVKRLSCGIVFPKERPCLNASLHYKNRVIPLVIKQLSDGRAMVRFSGGRGYAYSPYTIRWSW